MAAGIHNDFLTELARSKQLTVISRTSVLVYRSTEKSVSTIARELNVGTVVEGALQSAGNRVRLSVQLIDGTHDVHRWAEFYDRELTAENLFSIQTELTGLIVDSLQAELLERRAHAPTTDLEAYRLATEGRMQFDLKTQAGFMRAIELFEAALELDPDYALAWVGLADSLALMEDYGYGGFRTPPGKSRTCRRTGIGACTRLGRGSYVARTTPLVVPADTGSARGVRAGHRAPTGVADAHNWHAWSCLIVGRVQSALGSARCAVELNPLSAEAVSNLALALIANGDHVSALNEARRGVDLSPAFTTGEFYAGIALYRLGRFGDAVTVLTPLSRAATGELTVPWSGLGPDVTLALAHAGSGDLEAASAVVDSFNQPANPFATGVIHLGMGEIEKAFAPLGRVEEISAWPSMAIHFLYPGVWRTIRDEARFDDLLRVASRSWNISSPT